MKPLFLYLHGFASSPASTKARAFDAWARSHDLPIRLLDLRVPSLEHLLLSAMQDRVITAIDDALNAAPEPRRVCLIGSSLGGLTACRVAEIDARVGALFLMAPAFDLAARWQARLGSAWSAWKTTGSLEIDDHSTRQKARVHWRFVEELAEIDAARGVYPALNIPTRIVHGTADDVVDIEVSRMWVSGKPNAQLVEVADGHELGASIPRILQEANDFFGLSVSGTQ